MILKESLKYMPTGRKNSLKRQLVILIVGAFASVLVLMFLLNHFFLGEFYERDKIKNIKEAYEEMDASNSDYSSEVFQKAILSDASRYNLQYTIVDSDFEQIYTTSKIGVDQASRLFGYVVGINHQDVDILEASDSYTIQKSKDMGDGLTYLEIWGSLSNGDYFLIRTPMESINEAAKLSNLFFTFVGLIVVIIVTVIVRLVSERLIRPITQLTEISEKMANMDFNARYTLKNRFPNEIDELGEHFNVMSNELESKISDLKTLNAELKKDVAEKTKVDERRQEFINNVSHELKTPIALIQGYAEGLKDGIADDEDSKNYYYDVIIDESAKMNHLVRQLLDLSAIETGKSPLDIKRFDIAEMIRSEISGMDIMAKQAEASISFDYEGTCFVWGDEFKIEEVLTNYLSNAIHHVGGEKIIDVALTLKDESIVISVFNSGEPIPQDDLEHLWDKFYKVDKARTRAYGGSGIGLSIVKAIMEFHEQHYGVINHSNGVEFWFTLDPA